MGPSVLISAGWYKPIDRRDLRLQQIRLLTFDQQIVAATSYERWL